MNRKLFINCRTPKLSFLTVLAFVFISLSTKMASAQCTLSATGNITWNNAAPPACVSGGNAGSYSVIIIPVGTNLIFNGNTDTWTGSFMQVYGGLTVTAAGQATINASVEIKSGGTLTISSKLNLGTTANCGYTLVVNSGGLVNVAGGTSERLGICGTEIARGGTAGCNNNYPNGSPSYCEPSGGFSGPTGFDEDGVNGTLPVSLLYYNVQAINNRTVQSSWATATEQNTAYFSVERSVNGSDFIEIGRVKAAGNSSVKKEYSFTDTQPLIGRTYYRLKEVGSEGFTEHFSMRVIDFYGRKGITVSPNPSTGNENVTIALNFSNDQRAFATITDISGLEIKKFSFTGTEYKLPFDSSKGSYILTVSVGGQKYTSRFIVY
jgi:hypothetical protein